MGTRVRTWDENAEDSPDLKRLRTETMSRMYSSDELRILDQWFELLWPEPLPKPYVPTISKEENKQGRVALSARYKSWKEWTIYQLFVNRNTSVSPPYWGLNLPPEGAREATTLDYTKSDNQIGTAILIRLMTHSLVGPRYWSHKKPFDDVGISDDSIWSHKWFMTDFHNWVKDPRFFTDFEAFHSSSQKIVYNVAGTQLNAYTILRGERENSLGDYDSTRPAETPQEKKDREEEEKERRDAGDDTVKRTWGKYGVQKQNYPVNWPPAQFAANHALGLFPDWPSPKEMLDPDLNPNLPSPPPPQAMICPPHWLRKLFFKVKKDSAHQFENADQQEKFLLWLRSSAYQKTSPNHQFFNYFALEHEDDSVPKIIPPSGWTSFVLFEVLKLISHLDHVAFPFTHYRSLHSSDDIGPSYEQLFTLLKQVLDKKKHEMGKNYLFLDRIGAEDKDGKIISFEKDHGQNPLPLRDIDISHLSPAKLISFSPASEYFSVIRELNSFLTDPRSMELAETAFVDFSFSEVDTKTSKKVWTVYMRWAIHDLLFALGIDQSSSSSSLTNFRQAFSTIILQEIGRDSLAPSGDIVIDPVNPNAPSNFAKWSPGLPAEVIALLNDSKIANLFDVWSAQRSSIINGFSGGDLSSVFETWSLVNSNPVFGFIVANPIPELISKGVFGETGEFIKHLFNPVTDYDRLVQKQFEIYILWCYENSRVLKSPGYPKVGSPVQNKDGSFVFNSKHQKILNVIPNMGILSAKDTETPTSVKFMGVWYLLFGDDFWRFIKTIFIETLDLLLDALRLLLDTTKKVLGMTWPWLLGIGLGIAVVAVGIDAVEKRT